MQLVVRQQNTGSNDKAELKVNSSIFSDSDALSEESNNQALSIFSLFLLSHKPDLSSKLTNLISMKALFKTYPLTSKSEDNTLKEKTLINYSH